MSKSWAACLGLACLLPLGGCASMQVRMGLKVPLDKTPITSMTAKLRDSSGIAPGQKSQIMITMTEPGGKVLSAGGNSIGKLMWQDIQFTPAVVDVSKSGVVSLSQDPRISDGKVGHVTVTVPSHPDLRAEVDVPFRYNIHYTANFSGPSGMNGFNGTDGISGISGTTGSFDPNNPSAGGNGSDGTNGSDGQNGGDGGNAPPVEVMATLDPGAATRPLLQVSVSAQGQQQLYLVDPQGGSVTVTANGGSGGQGGKGGRGGRGGSGGIGSPNGNSGRDGMDGNDGRNGFDGRGGEITVIYDPQARPFLKAIQATSRYGPAPVYKEEQVDPLW